jgi:hypothetical protein
MRIWFRRSSTLAGLALAALGLTAAPAAAQQQTEAGFLGGASFSTFFGADSIFSTSASFRSSTGFAGGFYLAFPVAKSLMVEPEIVYINKGAGVENTPVTFNLNYIEIPVLLRYAFTQDGGPFAYVGPYVGFNVKCNTVVDTLPVPCSDQDISANTTFGGTIGIGFRKEAWGFDIRYDYDFSDAIKDESVKNSALMALLRLNVNQ